MFSTLGFLIVIVMLFWISRLSKRITVLEKKFTDAPVTPSPTRVAPSGESLPHLSQVPISAVPIQSAPSTPPATKTSEMESELAEGWLTKIGVLALIIGVGFFIKYAIDQGWISEWTRVLMGLALGGLLLVLGNIWKDRYVRYAASLSGGGLALMYFSFFAAYQFYHLLPQSVSLVLMVLVSVLGVYVAHRRKSLGLAMLATSGAYLSPLMLHGGVDQHASLFLYLGLLNITALIICFSFYWNELLLVSFLGSAVEFTLWGLGYLNAGNTMAATAFAAFVFLLFTIVGAASFAKAAKENRLPKDAEKFFGLYTVILGIFYLTSLVIMLDNRQFHDYLAVMGLLGAVGAFLAYAIVDRLEHRGVNYPLAFVGTSLLALTCIWQFEGKTTDFMLIVLGLVLVLTGVFLKRAELRVWGLVTLVGSVFGVLFTPYDLKNYTFILNSKFGLVVAEVFALWFTGWLYKQVEPTDSEKQASETAHVIGSLLLWFGFSWELAQYFRGPDTENIRNLLLSLWWIAYGTALLVFGAVSKSVLYKKIAIVIFALAIIKVFLYDVLALEMGYRIVSFIVLGAILLTVSYAYQRNKERIAKFLAGEYGKQ